MNNLTYQIECVEKEGSKDCQWLMAEVSFNREPIDESENKADLDIWVSWRNENGEIEGKPELPSFNEETAIALRDFLNFCFPPKCGCRERQTRMEFAEAA